MARATRLPKGTNDFSNSATDPAPVTIVVPIYGDLTTLMACVESLKHNVNLARNRILLVNDCGPDADLIESSLLAKIEGWTSIRYERNQRNLGFLGTCNRAVTELDTTENDILLLNSDTVTTPGFLEEMSAVLYLSPLHGIACARSNNATIASFPFTLRDPSAGYEIPRTAEVHAALSCTVRRYSISPVAHGFCFLVRRALIETHGLFDEAFAPGYYEEYDFCLRMNEIGYVSILANRALVFHVGNRSFDGVDEADALCGANQKLFYARYPFFERALEGYFLDRDAVDVFADALLPADEVRRVLFDVDVIPKVGLPENTCALLAALQRARDPKHLVVSVAVPDDHRNCIAGQHPELEVIPHSHLSQIWDVAIAFSDTVSCSQLIRLNRVSPRWVFTSTNIDRVSTWRRRAGNISERALAQDALRYADAIIALSKGVSIELLSCAGRGIIGLPATSIVELDGMDADSIVRHIVDRYGRSPIDVEQLRARWDYFACLACYGLELSRRDGRTENAAARLFTSVKRLMRKHGSLPQVWS